MHDQHSRIATHSFDSSVDCEDIMYELLYAGSSVVDRRCTRLTTMWQCAPAIRTTCVITATTATAAAAAAATALTVTAAAIYYTTLLLMEPSCCRINHLWHLKITRLMIHMLLMLLRSFRAAAATATAAAATATASA
jgi:hypothetical protein